MLAAVVDEAFVCFATVLEAVLVAAAVVVVVVSSFCESPLPDLSFPLPPPEPPEPVEAASEVDVAVAEASPSPSPSRPETSPPSKPIVRAGRYATVFVEEAEQEELAQRGSHDPHET